MKLFDLFLFFIIALLFLHIRKHRYSSSDMEVLIFEGDKKEKLEIMCDFKQPIFFQINPEKENLIEKCNYDSIEKIGGTGNVFDHSFIHEQGLGSFFESDFLRPSLNRFEKQYTDYSIYLGGASGSTEDDSKIDRFSYDISHRQYLLATQGSILVTLVPPKHASIFKTDYHDMKFEYGEVEDIKTLPVTLKVGDCLFIPALWGYKISFLEKGSYTQFRYKSLMNILSYADYYVLHFLQKLNTKYRFS